MPDELVDLNFKVPRDFRRAFKHAAVECDISNVEFLKRLFGAWQQHNQTEPCPSPFQDLRPARRN